MTRMTQMAWATPKSIPAPTSLAASKRATLFTYKSWLRKNHSVLLHTQQPGNVTESFAPTTPQLATRQTVLIYTITFGFVVRHSSTSHTGRQAFIDVTHRLEFLCIAFHNAFYDWQVANGQPHLGTEQMCRDFAASLTEKTSKNLANHPLARLFDPDAPMEWMPFLVPQDDPRSYVVIGI